MIAPKAQKGRYSDSDNRLDKPTPKKAQQANDNQRTWDDTEESETEEGRLVIDTTNDGSDMPKENEPNQPEEREPTCQQVEAENMKLSKELKKTQLEDGELPSQRAAIFSKKLTLYVCQSSSSSQAR